MSSSLDDARKIVFFATLTSEFLTLYVFAGKSNSSLAFNSVVSKKIRRIP